MSATSRYYRPPTETKRTKTYEELFGVPESAERIAYDKEQARLEEQAKKERQEADRKRREAYFAEQEKIKSDTLVAEGKEIVGSYRDQYSTEQLFELGAVNSFEIAKVVADETYKQYWYDKANDIIGNFTNEDYKLIAEPQYETYRVGKGGGVERTRQVLPEGYEELQEINSYIEKGPLDFSNEETHKMLIKPPQTKGGYGKHQEWIDESDPLRQAVEAQADVMKNYLDKEGISITKDFEDGNPNNIYGEGIYLNTGTAAHIDWDSDLKRMQRYMTAPDSEVGTYSQVFYRPEKSTILDHWMVDIMAAVTGTSDLLSAGRGGDIGDILEGAVIGSVAPDFLETGLDKLGIDADLFGIDPNTFSDSLNEVQTDMIKGKSGTESLLKEFGGAVTENLAGVIGDAAGGVLGGAVDLLDDTFDYIGDTALVGAVEAGGKALGGVIEAGAGIVGEAGQGVIDLGKDIGEAVVDTADDLLDTFGKKVVDPALKEGKKVAEAVVDKADDALDYLGEEYVDPALQQGKEIGQDLIDKGKDIGEGIVDTVDNVVDKFGEEAVDPALAKAKDLGQDLIDKGKDAGEFVVDTVDDAFDYLGKEYIDPALQAVKNIELPEGPDIDFPKIDWARHKFTRLHCT